ncbi:hypothetical protein ACFX2I_015602 [Malus domestica]
MGEPSTHIDLATFLEIPVGKEPQAVTATPAHPRMISPVWRLSPSHNGSTLYDSYEFRAVTHQLNKAILASKASSSPLYMYCFNSPLYRQGLSRIAKESAKTPKRAITGDQKPPSCATAGDQKPSARPAGAVTKGFVARAWRKVKQGFIKNKQKNEAFYAGMNPLLVEVRTPACLSLSCFVEIERVSHSSRSTALPVSSHTISYPTSIGFNSL